MKTYVGLVEITQRNITKLYKY